MNPMRRIDIAVDWISQSQARIIGLVMAATILPATYIGFAGQFAVNAGYTNVSGTWALVFEALSLAPTVISSALLAGAVLGSLRHYREVIHA